MKIYPLSKKLEIYHSDNKKNKYLYNYVLDVVREYNLPANFSTEKIELTRTNLSLIKRLAELKIHYRTAKKND